MEIGLKFRKEVDESSANFQITTDRADPIFSSRESESRFILTASLKGYKRRNISIDINEDGTLISIRCERRVKETTMIARKLYKKEIEVKGFKKVFRIPDGVVLDKIKAKFDEEESILIITMPKKVKGVRGTLIEEIKEKEELIDEKVQTTDATGQEKTAESGDSHSKDNRMVSDLKDGEKEQKLHDDNVMQEKIQPKLDLEPNHAESSEVNEQQVEPVEQDNQNHVHENVNKEHGEEENDKKINEGPRVHEPSLDHQESVSRGEPKDESFKICTPIIAGSALLLSLVVFVVHIIRNKNQSTTRRD